MLQLNSPKYHVRNLTQEARLNSLATKAKRGNSEAFEQLYDRFQTDVFRMVYYRIDWKSEKLSDMIDFRSSRPPFKNFAAKELAA
jgi:hypothetical protein